MRSILLLPCIAFSFGTHAGEDLKKVVPEYVVTKKVADPEIEPGKSVARFTSEQFSNGKTVLYSVDGENYQKVLTDNAFDVALVKGRHLFQFYVPGHSEIYTDTIDFSGGYRTYVTLNFRDMPEMQAEKPVIYVYPETDQSVSVQVKPTGDFSFTYPEYRDGWNGTAHPDGSMTIGGTTYPYLFWEAAVPSLENVSDRSSGFVLRRGEVTAFLETRLVQIGLTAQERTDFITYWGPRLCSQEWVFLRFVWGEATTAFAGLSVSPQPDHVNRLYIVWSTENDPKRLPQPEPQELPVFDRTGFDVLEWGGSELPSTML